jgi:hypothetical protein
MRLRGKVPFAMAACAAALMAGPFTGISAQGGRGGVAPGLFTATDADKDGAVTRDELKAAFDRWYTQWDAEKTGALTQEQMVTASSAAAGRRRRTRRPTPPTCRR